MFKFLICKTFIEFGLFFFFLQRKRTVSSLQLMRSMEINGHQLQSFWKGELIMQ